MELHYNLVGRVVICHFSLDLYERPSAAFEQEYVFPPVNIALVHSILQCLIILMIVSLQFFFQRT
jgi:hypothetical protein